MSRCWSIVNTLPNALRASGHATPYDYCIARLNYLCSADQYLSCAAGILSKAPSPSSPPTTADGTQIRNVKENTRTVLRDLYRVFGGLSGSEGRSQDDLRHGYSDYYTLICNILNTFNVNYETLYPLLRQTLWTLDIYLETLGDLRLRLGHPPSGAKHAVIIGAQPRYIIGNNLNEAIDSYIRFCMYVLSHSGRTKI